MADRFLHHREVHSRMPSAARSRILHGIPRQKGHPGGHRLELPDNVDHLIRMANVPQERDLLVAGRDGFRQKSRVQKYLLLVHGRRLRLHSTRTPLRVQRVTGGSRARQSKAT